MIARVLHLVGFELRKLWGRRFLMVPQSFYTRRGKLARSVLAPPFIFIVLLVLIGTTFSSELAAKVFESVQRLQGSGDEGARFKTAWSVMASSAIYGEYLGLVFLLVLAGMSVSEETQLGTLKAVLFRPYRRFEFIASKAVALSIFVVLVVVVLWAAGFTTAAYFYDFSDIVDPDYEDYVKVESSEMVAASIKGFLLLIPPLLALVAFAVLVSTVVDQTGFSVGAAIGGAIVLYLLADLSRPLKAYLFIGYVKSSLETLKDMGLSYDVARFKVKGMILSTVVCLGSAGLFYGVAAWRLSARDVGD